MNIIIILILLLIAFVVGLVIGIYKGVFNLPYILNGESGSESSTSTDVKEVFTSSEQVIN